MKWLCIITYSIPLRRIDTKNINKNMSTYKYKKLNDVITINYSAVQSTITLTYNNSPVYFGLEDADENYEGNLTQTTYNINSDYDGCYAVTSNTQGSTVGTALVIMVSISKNDSENERTITYKYNNTPLFKILQSGINCFYFNKVEITQALVNKSVYMIVIDNEFTDALYVKETTTMPALNYTFTRTIYFFYALTHQYNLNTSGKFTYISGGGDIIGNPKNDTFEQIPQILGKYDSAKNTITRIKFNSYKTQIKYIGLFTKLYGSSTTYELQALIDFTESSKYNVE